MGQLLTGAFWQNVIQRAIDWSIQTLPAIVVIFVLAFVLLRLVTFSVSRLKKLMMFRAERGAEENPAVDVRETEKRVDTLLGILRMAARIAVWAVIGMLLLLKLGVDVAPLIAGAGIVGLAVGFGAQELVRDVISGFFMLLENQVRTGDVAIVNGTGGLVETIGLRTITLRDWSGTVHVVQNGKISSLSNMTKEFSFSVFEIGVAYKEDTDAVVAVMKAVGEELRADGAFAGLILEPLEVAGVDSFGDSAVVIKARFKTRPIQQWNVGREYRRRLKKAFDGKGIEIPFPHRTIYWGEQIKPLVLQSGEKAGGVAAQTAG